MWKTFGASAGYMSRDFGLTSRCSSSLYSSRLAISGTTLVQHQWAPEGAAGFSVKRLIATRMLSYLLQGQSMRDRPAPFDLRPYEHRQVSRDTSVTSSAPSLCRLGVWAFSVVPT